MYTNKAVHGIGIGENILIHAFTWFYALWKGTEKYRDEPYSWRGGGLRNPTLMSFLSHRQTAGASELKLSDFVGTFIAHLLAKNVPGQVRSSQVTRTDYVTRPSLKFEVVPKRSSNQFQTFGSL